jgi:hypothetical protein
VELLKALDVPRRRHFIIPLTEADEHFAERMARIGAAIGCAVGPVPRRSMEDQAVGRANSRDSTMR